MGARHLRKKLHAQATLSNYLTLLIICELIEFSQHQLQVFYEY